MLASEGLLRVKCTQGVSRRKLTQNQVVAAKESPTPQPVQGASGELGLAILLMTHA